MVYVEGYALCSALGESAETSMQQLKISALEASLLKDANKYFYMKNPPKNDYYDIMEHVAKVAMEDANLTQN
jgi:hypothetical protein